MRDYEPPEGICEDCGQFCQTRLSDEGIGSYEYGSIRAIHHDWRVGSTCCNAPVVPGGERVVRIAHHVAKRNYGKIKSGERYQLTVFKMWKTGGPAWFRSERSQL